MIIQPKEFDYFKAWLLFFLVSTALGIVLGIIIGSFVAAFMGAGGATLAQMTTINRIAGCSVYLSPTSVFALSSENISSGKSKTIHHPAR